jgi:phosphoribosyl 1,2-cyclic phosphodiesterase
MKYILSCFDELGVHPSELSGIFLSHEHSDHIRGAGALARKLSVPIWSNRGTWSVAQNKLGKIPIHKEFITEQPVKLNDLEILPIPVSHDAREPVCFKIQQQSSGLKAGIITDIGILTPPVKHYLYNSHLLMLESNYDLDMLVHGKYPENVKLFILGDLGHLSNTEAGESLIELVGEKTENVLLSHISKDNNTPELAFNTVADIIKEHGISKSILGLTYHNQMGKQYSLE